MTQESPSCEVLQRNHQLRCDPGILCPVCGSGPKVLSLTVSALHTIVGTVSGLPGLRARQGGVPVGLSRLRAKPCYRPPHTGGGKVTGRGRASAAARWEIRLEQEDRGRLPRAVPYRTATRLDEASQRCVLAEDSPLHDGPGRSRELRRTLGSRQRASTRQRPWDVSRPVRPVLHQDGLARTGQVTCVCRHGSRRAESRGMGVQALSLWARHVQYLGLRPDPNAPANHADRRASDPSRQEAPRPGPRMVADVGERRNA